MVTSSLPVVIGSFVGLMRCFFGTSSALFNFLVEGLELRKLHRDREFLGMRDSDDNFSAKVRFLIKSD